MKKGSDVHRHDVSFNIDDWVYVKLRPYRQSSVSGQVFHKLEKRYYGPYKITQKIGPVAYKLALSESSKIHPVFHCSLLKPHFGPLHSDNSLPPSAIEGKPIIQPMTILDRKWNNSTPPKLLVLVQWLGLSPEDSTWEDWAELQDTYHLEDKVFLIGPRNDSTQQQRPKRVSRKPTDWEEYVH